MKQFAAMENEPRALSPVDRADDLTCEICGAQMIQRQCKITCPNCGFTRDCSDP